MDLKGVPRARGEQKDTLRKTRCIYKGTCNRYTLTKEDPKNI